MRKTLTALLIILSACCYAQSVAQDAKPAGVAKRNFKHHAKIEASYDPSSNKTTVVLNSYKLSESTTEAIGNMEYFYIMCGFTYDGRVLTATPNRIELHIISDGTRGWKFDNDSKRVLTITVDGERLELGTMTVVRSRHYQLSSSPVSYSRSGYLEEVYTALTYDGMVKVASGKRVLLNIGQLKLELRDEHMEALRDLVSRMTP